MSPLDRRTLVTRYLAPLAAFGALSSAFWRGLRSLRPERDFAERLSDVEVADIVATFATVLLERQDLGVERYRAHFHWRLETSTVDRLAYRSAAHEIRNAFRQYTGFDLLHVDAPLRWETMRLIVQGGQCRHPALALIRSQALKLFRRSDALLLLGYDDIPGRRRGLDAYLESV